MIYRPDIDGLRAVAVLAVVIFHLGIAGFEGGFIGVDVFFVISGYLITSNIIRSYDKGTFTLPGFYFRRIRRLVPALLATVGVTTVFAGLLMTPYDLLAYGRSAVAAIFSLSNFVFFFEAGYWDTASELKPLLHTWSLGVEEQFYLFWPAMMLLLLGAGRRWFYPGLVAIGIAGVVLTLVYTRYDSSAAFYLLPFRVFQFAAGALVIVSADRLAKVLPAGTGLTLLWLGLVLIFGSVHFIDESVAFPGWVILVPTLGAFLVLLSGAITAARSGKQPWFLANPLMVWTGRVSYSMYLVHWPVVALYRYEYGLELSPADQVMLALVTLAATVLLHYGVERRFYARHADETGRLQMPDNRFAVATLLAALVLASAPASAWLHKGWAWRFPSLSLTPDQIEAGKKDRFTYSRKACFVHYEMTHPACTGNPEIRVLVIGNSHEPDGVNFFRGAYGDDSSIGVLSFGTVNECDDFRKDGGRLHTSDEKCQRKLDGLLNQDKIDTIDVVLYSVDRPFDDNPAQVRLVQILEELKRRKPGLRIMTLGGYISTTLHCSRYVNETGNPESCALPSNVTYFEDEPTARPFFQKVSNLSDYYIDRVALLCKNRVLQSCLMRAEDGSPAFYDSHHHSRPFAEMSGRLYVERHGDFVRDVLAK